MNYPNSPVEVEKDIYKLKEVEIDEFKQEAARRLREISKHRESGGSNDGRGSQTHLNRCLEELRSGFQERALIRRNNLVRRIEDLRRQQFEQLRDLQRVEENARTPPQAFNNPRNRRFTSSVAGQQQQQQQQQLPQQGLPKGPKHRRIVSS